MKRLTTVAILIGLVALAPNLVFAATPVPIDTEVVDLRNDDGTTLGVLWRWQGEADENTRLWVLIKPDEDIVSKYELSADQLQLLQTEAAKVEQEITPIFSELKAAKESLKNATNAFIEATENNGADVHQLRKARWKAQNLVDKLVVKRDKLRDRLLKLTGKLADKKQTYDFLTASLAYREYIQTDKSNIKPTLDLKPKSRYKRNFGHAPKDGDKWFVAVGGMRALNPKVIDGTFVGGAMDAYSSQDLPTKFVPLETGKNFSLQMIVYQNPDPQNELSFTEVLALEDKVVVNFGSAIPTVGLFDTSKNNNFIFALLFTGIILGAILLARRNPNLFIRRIQGLEAVDEAIGRATEMGKPVLYLCGLASLADLPTLAAINILGRVARRIADYDSELIVPCRDPVVLTVCQEVVKEAYLEAGRPDAYREDNIFFLTEDQFSFTASTCAIMMREKPAANFFMGYYYAESLLLAETGASTGAIQIAGTDALHQLPFFITTCDYTLIGEELYAASAYLSREPLLLGSLKGQDVGKAFVMLLMIVQTILFMFNDNFDWLRTLVEPIN